MKLEKLIPLALATLACGATGPVAHAAPQLAQKVEISPTDYPHAKCNDSTQATYYLRGAGTDGAISGRKWLIFLHGGGSCTSDAECAERWHDPTAGSDGIIGSHANMTAATDPTNDFNGKGILDFDGVDNPPASNPAGRGTNPFAGFNRIMVPYCSSDSYSSRNIVARNFNSLAHLGASSPGQQIPALTSIRFSGRFIVEAVADLLRNGGIKTGRTVERGSADYVEPPLAATDEVVISGSSAGGFGVIRNLDNMAAILRGSSSNMKVFGVIDAADVVGVLPDANITGDPDFANATYYEATGTDAVDTSCQRTYPLGTSNKCFNPIILLKHFVETPHFVAQQSFDGVIHTGVMQSLAQQLSQSVPAAMAEALAVQYIRNRISAGALQMGGGLTDAQHLGYFIPNYDSSKHQLMAEDEWFFNSPLASYSGNDPRLSTDLQSTMGLPRGLACFRFKLTGQGSGCVDNGDAKVINSTYPTNPLVATYDAPSSTLTLPFLRLSNNSYFKNVRLFLSAPGTVTVNDPSVGGLGSPIEYVLTTNTLKLPFVTLGSTTYERVSLSRPGLGLLSYEVVSF